MNRVLVVGGSGAGKSVFSRALGERTGLPVVHMDRLYWKPGWVATPDDEFLRAIEDAAAGERWIIDGNYRRMIAPRLARADAVIWLDLNTPLRLWRVLRRQGKERADLPVDLVENRFTMDFLRHLHWTAWQWPRVSRPALRAIVEASGVPVIDLRSRRAVAEYLTRVVVR